MMTMTMNVRNKTSIFSVEIRTHLIDNADVIAVWSASEARYIAGSHGRRIKRDLERPEMFSCCSKIAADDRSASRIMQIVTRSKARAAEFCLVTRYDFRRRICL